MKRAFRVSLWTIFIFLFSFTWATTVTAAFSIGYQAPANPTQQGFNVVSCCGPLPQVNEPIADDLGYPAWSIAGLGLSSQYFYISGPLSAEQNADLANEGFSLTLRGRVLQGSAPAYDGGSSTVIGLAELNTETRRYSLWFGINSSGNAVVVLPTSHDLLGPGGSVRAFGPSYTLNDAGYHTYDLAYDPITQSASLYIDGTERISGYTGHSQNPQDLGLILGAFSGGGMNFNLVRLTSPTTVPGSNSGGRTIDTLENIGADGTPVTSRIIGDVVVDISTSAGINLGARTYFDNSPPSFHGAGSGRNAPLNPGNVSGTRFISTSNLNLSSGNFVQVRPIVFRFSKPILGFGLTTLDLLENSVTASSRITLEARDASGQNVASQTRSGPQGPSGIDLDWYVSSGLPEITEVRLLSNNLSAGQGYGLDDLVVDTVTWFGSTLQTMPSYQFSTERNGSKTGSITLLNIGNESRTATPQIVNPHPNLGISLESQPPVTIAAGTAETLSLQIDATSTPVGLYEDILLEVTVDDGSTLYSNLSVYVTEPGQADLPDLTVSSGDIGYISGNAGDPGTLTATVHNRGLSSASNIQVDFYEFGTLLGSTVIDEITGNGSKNASITLPALSSGDHLIRVVVDPAGTIQELDETNNEASKIVQPEGVPGPTTGHILVTGSLPTTVYTDALFTLSGKAVYDLVVNGTRNTDYVVKGGSVQITIQDEAGHEWVYGDVHTDINGNIRKSLQAPSLPGTYHILMTVTDKTFIGKRELAFKGIAPPPPGSTPPSPPAPPTSTGSGQWSYDPVTGGWTWTWTILPSEPTPQSDLRVFSENIFFTDNHPAVNDEITVFAQIQYWATSTDLVAEDIPVNIYVTYPGSPALKIGETTIGRLSVGSPDFGSRYVFATWKNQGESIYLVEFEIDPSYVEENNLNNAATRAIIVGQLQISGLGVISGQVTDTWGVGIGGVPIQVTYADGTLLTSSVTDASGFYLVEDVPIGNMHVRVEPPAGYQPDAETKTVEVIDSTVSAADFVLFLEAAPADVTPPVLNLPGDIVTEATGPLGADVTYSVSAQDDVDGAITPSCAPSSASTFPVGTTNVTCTAADAAGNTVSGSFNVSVIDITPPTLLCPPDISLIEGNPINLGTPTVSDIVDTTPTLANNAPTIFPLGTTDVIWTAADGAGNQASCVQQVTIVAAPVNQPPVADAGGPYTESVGVPVTLDAGASYDPDGQITAYEWDLDGDGSYDLTSASATVSYAWNVAFNGTVGLKVTDNEGFSATDTTTVQISATTAGICGDLDDDGDVDGNDRNILRSALNSTTGDSSFMPEADYDGDGLISYNDYREWYACYKAYIAP